MEVGYVVANGAVVRAATLLGLPIRTFIESSEPRLTPSCAASSPDGVVTHGAGGVPSMSHPPNKNPKKGVFGGDLPPLLASAKQEFRST